MPVSGRASALWDAAQAGRLAAEPLTSLASPPWDYDALQALRSPHGVAALQTPQAGDAQVQGPAVVVVGTATFTHPPTVNGPAPIGGLLIVSYSAGGVLLYQCVPVTPPAVTSPDNPTVSVPVSLWDCYPGG